MIPGAKVGNPSEIHLGPFVHPERDLSFGDRQTKTRLAPGHRLRLPGSPALGAPAAERVELMPLAARINPGWQFSQEIRVVLTTHELFAQLARGVKSQDCSYSLFHNSYAATFACGRG
jgi:hypothetical protein